MNDLPPGLTTGTFGELLVQLRLLEYGIQAAPPLKDSGNDLIAIRGEVFKSIQVKTTCGDRYPKDRLPDRYHILAVVQLLRNKQGLLLDESRIFLIPRNEVEAASTSVAGLEPFLLNTKLIEYLFR